MERTAENKTQGLQLYGAKHRTSTVPISLVVAKTQVFSAQPLTAAQRLCCHKPHLGPELSRQQFLTLTTFQPRPGALCHAGPSLLQQHQKARVAACARSTSSPQLRTPAAGPTVANYHLDHPYRGSQTFRPCRTYILDSLPALETRRTCPLTAAGSATSPASAARTNMIRGSAPGGMPKVRLAAGARRGTQTPARGGPCMSTSSPFRLFRPQGPPECTSPSTRCQLSALPHACSGKQSQSFHAPQDRGVYSNIHTAVNVVCDDATPVSPQTCTRTTVEQVKHVSTGKGAVARGGSITEQGSLSPGGRHHPATRWAPSRLAAAPPSRPRLPPGLRAHHTCAAEWPAAPHRR